MRKKLKIVLCLLALCSCFFIGGCEFIPLSETPPTSTDNSSETPKDEGYTSEMAMSEGIELSYNKWTDSYSIVGIGTCTDTEIKLSGAYEGKKVTEIKASAFEDNRNITKVEIDDNIEKIDEKAFARCTYLIQVSLGESVSVIGANAFNGCYNLLEICNNSDLDIQVGSNKNGKIAENAKRLVQNNQFSSVEKEGDFLYFQDDEGVLLVGYFGQATTMELPTYTTSYEVGKYAFYGTNIKNFRIVSGMTDFTFFAQLDLEEIYYEGSLQDWCNLIWESGESNPLSKGAKLFVENDNVVEENISIGFDVQAYAFYQYSYINELTLTQSCKSVGEQAFRGCANLKNVVIEDNGISVLSEGIFADCATLEIIDLGTSITQIGKESLYRTTALKSITIPSSVNLIDYRAFYKAESLTKIIIPGTVQTIGEESFAYCSKLTELELQEGIKTIGTSAFCYCIEIQTAIIPDSVTTLGEGTFRNCEKLQFVSIGDGVTDIPFRTFYLSGAIHTIVIGSNVGHIGPYSIDAGYSREQKTVIYFKGTEMEYNQIRKEDGLLNNANGNREILYYSATQPSSNASNYWYYDQDNKPVRWA